MQIEKKHKYHGAALAQLVEDRRFTALNKASHHYGHYLVNDATRLFVKYSSKTQPWHFTFSDDETVRIANDSAGGGRVFIALVCGDDAVCAFPAAELWQVIDRDSAGPQQVTVKRPLGKSMRVTGTSGELARTVARTDFPDIVLQTRGVR